MDAILSMFQKIWQALLSFRLTDFFDIILVTILIYAVIRLLRGSRAFQVIKGICLLLAAYLVVKLLNLEASEYLFSILFKNALIILVILFAPELRSLLERFGRRSFTSLSLLSFRNGEDEVKTVTDTVNDFCKAASDLSETKTGALVVFERETPLNDIINTGTIVDAASSPQLFNGLFFKNSALHDGAVVVRDGRIYAAGCILPLTNDDSLDSEFGTRHRAAVGMSQESDAVVVVVSEETGNISVAKDGTLKTGLQSGNLREFLLDELLIHKGDGKAKKKTLSGRFRKNGKGTSEKEGENDEK